MYQQELTIGAFTVKKVTVRAFEYFEQVKVTQACSGKMKNLWALNTSMTINPLCRKMARNKKSICSKCYAQKFMSYRHTCRKRYEENFKQLSGKILKFVPDLESEMVAKTPIFRFEEFGDIANEVQALNYLLIAIANPSVTFGWWTKHINIIDSVLKKHNLSVPQNLSIVASSVQMNKVSTHYCKYDFIDHVFTVYDKEYAGKHDVQTNCASSACYECQRCYRKGGDFHISELLK